MLYKVSRSYARGSADQDDLVQEISLQLWRSFPGYDPRLPFLTWMYRVALNVAISYRRREGRRLSKQPVAVAPLLEIVTQEDAQATTRSAPAEGAGALQRDEDLQRLDQLVQALAPLDRALMLLYLDEQPHAEIAAVLGLSVSNVGTKISRLKRRIRRDWNRSANGD